MASLMSNLFGPLNKSACYYFLIISSLFLLVFTFIIITEGIRLIISKEKIPKGYFSTGLILLFNIFLGYFINRLMYNMCIKSLD